MAPRRILIARFLHQKSALNDTGMKLYIADNIYDFDLAAALDQVSEQRRAQALKFKHEQGQRLCVLAYQLLQQGLRELYGITEKPVFAYNEHGKPSIVGHPEIHFNISHCHEAVVCAISDAPIGVDVETIRAYKERLVDYTMNDEEQAEIKGSDNPSHTFARLWTMKEATAKLIGTGITHDVKSLIDIQRYHYTTVETLKYIYTVCTFRA